MAKLNIEYIMKGDRDILIINGNTIIGEEDGEVLDAEDLLDILAHYLHEDINVETRYED